MRSLHLLSAALLMLGFTLSGCDSAGLDSYNDCRSGHPTCDDGGGDGGNGGGDDDGGGDGGDDGGHGGGGDGDGGDGDGGGDDDGGDDDGGTAGVFLPLDATATYLRTEEGDAFPAHAVPLSDLGVMPGERACFTAQGDVDFGGGTLASETGVPLVLAVFSRTDELSPETEPERVKGALDAGEDVVTPETNPNDYTTDIDEDFDASSACVIVPDEAAFVFFSAFDSFFLDNVATDDYGVTVVKKD